MQIGFAVRMIHAKVFKIGLVATLAIAMAGCSSIRQSRGYVVDALLTDAIQPGIDNQRSVEMTLGRPSFTSQYGTPTWYYVSSVTGQSALRSPRIRSHSVLAVQFDPAGNVVNTTRSGVDRVAFLSPLAAESRRLVPVR